MISAFQSAAKIETFFMLHDQFQHASPISKTVMEKSDRVT